MKCINTQVMCAYFFLSSLLFEIMKTKKKKKESVFDGITHVRLTSTE